MDFSVTKSGLPDKFRESSTAGLPEIEFSEICSSGLQKYGTHLRNRSL